MFSMSHLRRGPASATTRRSRAWLCALAAVSAAAIAALLFAVTGTQATEPVPAAVSGATAQVVSGCTLNGQPVPSFQADNAVFGTRGADVIDCTESPRARNIFGNNGNDTIRGSRFNDTIHGEFGDDTIRGLAGNDFLSGESDNDFLSGSTGTDRCVGGGGTDSATSCESVVQIP